MDDQIEVEFSQQVEAKIGLLKSGKPTDIEGLKDFDVAEDYRRSGTLRDIATDSLEYCRLRGVIPSDEITENHPQLATLRTQIKDFLDWKKVKFSNPKSSAGINITAIEEMCKDNGGLIDFLRGGHTYINDHLLPAVYEKGKIEGRGYWMPTRIELLRDALKPALPKVASPTPSVA